MKKSLILALTLTLGLNSALATDLVDRIKSKDYEKRNEAYLRDVQKRDAKRKYLQNLDSREPNGRMTVEQYDILSKHKNKEDRDEIRPVEIPTQPIPSEMRYAPQPTYKLVRYNDPPGSVELSLKKNFYVAKQQNSQGIISPDITKLVYAAIYYAPDSASTSAELFVIPLDKNETELTRVMKAHTSNRYQKPILATSKTIDNLATFRTLVPVDFSTDGTKLLVKEKIGNSFDGIWETDVWVYDFTTNRALKISEIRDAIIHHWTTYRGLPLIDKRWDIVPLGFSVEEPDRIICTAYAYTGAKPVFLGVWSVDINGQQSRLVSFDNNMDIAISENGFKLVQDGVKPYILVEDEEKQLKKIDKMHKKQAKKQEKDFNRECKAQYKAELRQINAQYRENIKAYNELLKYQGSTSYNEALEQYRKDKIEALEKQIQKDEIKIQKLTKQLELLDSKNPSDEPQTDSTDEI